MKAGLLTLGVCLLTMTAPSGFAQAAPELVPRWAELFAQAQDWPGAQEIADRVRPADVPGKGEAPIPPQAQQQISQLQQENEQLKMAADQMAQ